MATLAGQIARASDVVNMKYIRKQANEALTSTTTLQDDDDLTIALAVGNWRVEAFVSANSASATPNVKIAWTFGGTATTQRMCLGPGLGNTDNLGTSTAAGSGIMRSSAHGLTTAIPYGINSSGVIRETLLLEVTVAGTLTLQWAQNTSNATATNLSIASHLYLSKIEAP